MIENENKELKTSLEYFMNKSEKGNSDKSINLLIFTYSSGNPQERLLGK